MNSIDKSKVFRFKYHSTSIIILCSQIKPIPIQKTATLVNNFLVNTASFLNSFSDTVEQKLSAVSDKVTELEILLTVLEEKLNSVPILATETSSDFASADKHVNIPPRPENMQQTQTIELVEESSCPPHSSSLLDSEDYAPFIKMIKVGVPKFVVVNKAIAAGLDGAILQEFNP